MLRGPDYARRICEPHVQNVRRHVQSLQELSPTAVKGVEYLERLKTSPSYSYHGCRTGMRQTPAKSATPKDEEGTTCGFPARDLGPMWRC